MKNKLSQRDKILKHLRDKGFVTRNSAIRGDYGEIITRLSHYILQFRQEGMNIETKETTHPKETTYTLKDKPIIKEYRVNGEVVARKEIWG